MKIKQILSRLPLIFTLMLLLAFGSFAQQQSAISGGLNGAITDSTGAVLPGATVILVGPQGTRTLTTDNSGRFSINGLTPGYYNITVEKAGFKKLDSKHNEVVVNSSSTLNLSLPIGNASEVVEVSDSAVSIDTQSTAITTNLTDTFYESVPIARNVSAIFYAAPGVTASQVAGAPNQTGPGAANPSIGGASGLENLYVVDGVTITDQAFGGIGTYNNNYGSLGSGINLAYVKEVDVKTSAFEPQYGKATGGIVQIVTKSGSNQYHGGVGAYFGPGAWYASRKTYQQFNYLQTAPSSIVSNPQYDASVELGGYVPGLKNKLFFFGAFNPGLNQVLFQANSKNALTSAHGSYAYSTTTLGWAGKLTYKVGSSTTIEASSFGDPSRRNADPFTLSTTRPDLNSSSYNFGSRDSVIRTNTTISPTWVADVSYSYNYNHFNESPSAPNQFLVIDNTGNALPTPTAQTSIGFGDYYPTKNGTYSIALNTSKTFNALGQHTASVGYAYDHTNFLNTHTRSGGFFPIPQTNQLGQSLPGLFSSIPAGSVGALTDADFRVSAANTNSALTTTDKTCTACPTNLQGQKVYASIYRGAYAGQNVDSKSRYHSAYANDVYRMNRYITLNAGIRWEQQRIIGALANYSFGPSWSPRVGINIDPFGDKKGKLFFNFGRNYWALPLDAAIRQLGNEQDDTGYIFAPIVNADGSYTVIPDAAHNLNGLKKSTSADGTVNKFVKPSFASSSAEGILPGTKQEYEDEYVIGIERELGHSMVVKLRYTDRRLGRIIEDIGSQSPEGSQVDGGFNGGIANPNKGTDISINEQEVTYTPAQFAAAQLLPPDANGYHPSAPGCTSSVDKKGNVSTNDTGNIFFNGRNVPVGGACIKNADVAGSAGPGKNGADGTPDGFVNPVRRYQAVEFELDKRFSNHWLAIVNYRWGSLYGNYEGAYRNDNGQGDPGISSLFDFTSGGLGLLGDQFKNGYLSSDRRSVGNLFLSYSVASDTPYLRSAKGLTLGAGLRGQSGVPLSVLGDHPIYLNQGEVPIGGRGAAGRTPVSAQLDIHAGYVVPKLSDRFKLKLAMDLFNVANSQPETGRVQYLQTPASSVGSAPPLDLDYGKPTSFQGPFYARGSVRIEF